MDKKSTKYHARIESNKVLHTFLEPKYLIRSGSIPVKKKASITAMADLLEND